MSRTPRSTLFPYTTLFRSGDLGGRRQPVRQAKAAQAVGVGEDRERVGLLGPEIGVVVEVVERPLDRLAVGGAGAVRAELRDRLGGQVLEGDPGRVGLRRDRGGRQV